MLGVTFLPVYTWAKFDGVLWLACHKGPRAGVGRGGKGYYLGGRGRNSEIKKPIFCCSHLQFFENEFLDAVAKLRMSDCLSVRPYGKTRLQLEELL